VGAPRVATEPDVVGSAGLVLLLGGVDGAELDVVGAVELDSVVLGGLEGVLDVASGVVAVGSVLDGCEDGVEVVGLCAVVVSPPDRTNGDGLVVVTPVTDAAGGEPGFFPLLCSTRTRAVVRAASTATARIPTAQPALLPPCHSSGGCPIPTRSVVGPPGSVGSPSADRPIHSVGRSGTDGITSVASGGGGGVEAGSSAVAASASGCGKTAMPS